MEFEYAETVFHSQATLVRRREDLPMLVCAPQLGCVQEWVTAVHLGYVSINQLCAFLVIRWISAVPEQFMKVHRPPSNGGMILGPVGTVYPITRYSRSNPFVEDGCLNHLCEVLCQDKAGGLPNVR